MRSLIATWVLIVSPLAVSAAEEENPYKNAKVGDYATYTTTAEFGGLTLSGTVTQTVIAKTNKEVTIKITGHIEFAGNKMEIPAQEQTIDLTQPFDPTKGGTIPGGDASFEKDKDGKEKIKVNGKEYDSTWVSYKVKAKIMGLELQGNMKVWTAKDVVGILKTTMTADVADQKMTMTMELKETGNKKPEKD
ncbi:MAG: hypothetical protein RMJ56_13550 [Gemmataceae bacterium]|nr:hypothetical protein [Gemmata sp.]MDW8198618.1 hypothetical protein [Gemmataceae bacterium]